MQEFKKKKIQPNIQISNINIVNDLLSLTSIISVYHLSRIENLFTEYILSHNKTMLRKSNDGNMI